MKCISCGSEEFVNGQLEGVSFVPEGNSKRIFSTGIYGVKIMVCTHCGRIAELTVDVDVLRKVLKKPQSAKS